ncbi:MAG: hypothetical protein WAM94_03760, partial [Chromatiaceae bacterium]
DLRITGNARELVALQGDRRPREAPLSPLGDELAGRPDSPSKAPTERSVFGTTRMGLGRRLGSAGQGLAHLVAHGLGRFVDQVLEGLGLQVGNRRRVSASVRSSARQRTAASSTSVDTSLFLKLRWASRVRTAKSVPSTP